MAEEPVFYFDNRSPPVRSVRMLLNALDVKFEEKLIDLFKAEHQSPEFLKVNPLHTIPVLQHRDLTLTDSHAILIYLCEQYGGDDLWPKDALQRIRVLNQLFYSGTLLFRRDSDAIGNIVMNKIGKAAIEEHVVRIREQYDNMELFLSKSKFMAGDTLTIADISIVSIVSTVDMLLRITEDKWPRLCAWWSGMRELPYYAKSNDDGLLALKGIVQHCTDYPINF